jgi:hypothetical protein
MRDGELTHVTRWWSTHSGQNGRVTDVHTRGGHFTGGLYDVQGRAVFPLWSAGIHGPSPDLSVQARPCRRRLRVLGGVCLPAGRIAE